VLGNSLRMPACAGLFVSLSKVFSLRGDFAVGFCPRSLASKSPFLASDVTGFRSGNSSTPIWLVLMGSQFC